MKTVLICLAILPFVMDGILAIPLEDGPAARTFLQPNLKCGQTSALKEIKMNNASFNTNSQSCLYKIRPVNLRVCQLRIDINYLTLDATRGTGSLSCTGSRLHVDGLPFDLCGKLSLQHVYVPFKPNRLIDEKTIDFRASSNEVAFWDIVVHQIECNGPTADERQAPDGCLQYFYQQNYKVESFNYGDAYLANTKYAICFNRNNNPNAMLELTGITFSMDSNAATLGGFDDECLDVDVAATNKKDYIAIPFAEIFTGLTHTREHHSLFCDKSIDGKTLQFKGTGPIVIHVNTDATTDYAKETGFQFTYRIS